jgi:hypothetical protein
LVIACSSPAGLFVHVLVNQKFVGHLVCAPGLRVHRFCANLGIEHKLLIFSSSPRWTYTTWPALATLRPWLWFKCYWVAWAVLLAVVKRLFWVRAGRQFCFAAPSGRQRFTRSTVWFAAAGMHILFGGFIFYNTNVLHDYTIHSTRRRSGPRTSSATAVHELAPTLLTGVNLQVEIYPRKRAVEIQGTYFLVNNSQGTIDSVHLATGAGVETAAINFDQPSKKVLVDADHGHRIYAWLSLSTQAILCASVSR